MIEKDRVDKLANAVINLLANEKISYSDADLVITDVKHKLKKQSKKHTIITVNVELEIVVDALGNPIEKCYRH